ARTPVVQVDFDSYSEGDLGTSGVGSGLWTQLNTSWGRVRTVDVDSDKVVNATASGSGTLPGNPCVAYSGAALENDQYAKIQIQDTANLSSHTGVLCRASTDTGAGRDFYF